MYSTADSRPLALPITAFLHQFVVVFGWLKSSSHLTVSLPTTHATRINRTITGDTAWSPCTCCQQPCTVLPSSLVCTNTHITHISFAEPCPPSKPLGIFEVHRERSSILIYDKVSRRLVSEHQAELAVKHIAAEHWPLSPLGTWELLCTHHAQVATDTSKPTKLQKRNEQGHVKASMARQASSCRCMWIGACIEWVSRQSLAAIKALI